MFCTCMFPLPQHQVWALDPCRISFAVAKDSECRGIVVEHGALATGGLQEDAAKQARSIVRCGRRALTSSEGDPCRRPRPTGSKLLYRASVGQQLSLAALHDFACLRCLQAWAETQRLGLVRVRRLSRDFSSWHPRCSACGTVT